MMNPKTLSPIRPWKVLQRDLLLSGMPWLNVYREKVELATGRVLDDFYRVVLPDFVIVVPVTTAGELVMVRGYKHGLGRVTLSPPAGMLQPGEDPLAAAKREMLEETGYTGAEWKMLGKFVVDGNRQCGTMHLYLARQVHWQQASQEDDAEELEVELMSRQRVVEALQTGEIGTLAAASAVSLALTLGA